MNTAGSTEQMRVKHLYIGCKEVTKTRVKPPTSGCKPDALCAICAACILFEGRAHKENVSLIKTPENIFGYRISVSVVVSIACSHAGDLGLITI